MRAKIALVMAAVAMLGAVAAFRTALTEQETSRLERTLDQGQILELASRQGYLDKTSVYARLNDRYNQHDNLARYFQKQADEIRAQDPARASLLDLRAQEEITAARIFIPVRDYVYVDMNNDLKLEDSVEKLATADLAEFGFDVMWPEKPEASGNFPSIWAGLQRDIEKHEKRVVRLAMATVVFVLSLAAFTFAELSKAKSTRAKWFEIGGYALAGSALVLALIVEPASWKDFGLAAAAYGVLGFAGWKLSKKMTFLQTEGEEDEPCHPGEVEPLLFAGVRMHGSEKNDSFTRTVIFFIAVTAVLSAFSGLWYSRAATASNKAAGEAMEHQVELFKGSSRPATSIFYVLGMLATAQEYRSRFQAAKQRNALKDDSLPANVLGDPYEDMKMLAAMADAQDKNHEIADMLGSDDGPYADPRYPEKFVTQGLKRTSEEEYGLWDARNEMSLAWRKIANTELATITLYAIALYLFGQSLGMGRTRAAFILVFLSSWLVLLGAARALIVRLEPLPGRPHTVSAECRDPDSKEAKMDPAVDAAKHYAEGRRKSQTANNRDSYKEAAREFGCAVDARPSFALANFELARATWEAGTPQRGEGYVSITAKDALPSVVDHQDKALDALKKEGLGGPVGMLGDHGFDNVLLALDQHDRKYLKHGLQMTEAALNKDTKANWLRFNLGMSLLAGGKKTEGLAQYELGFKQKVDWELASGSITDLNIMLRHCEGLNSKAYCADVANDVARLKSRFVLAAWPAPDPKTAPLESGNVKISEVELAASPAGLGWHGRVQNYDPKRDVLTVMWYAHEDGWDVWRAIPSLSGKENRGTMTPEPDGRGFRFVSYLYGTSAHRCLQPGRYRAEVYANGRLVTDPAISLKTGSFDAAAFRDLNMDMCYPRGWVRWEPMNKKYPGLIDGYQDSKGTRGAFAFMYYYPKIGKDVDARDKFLRKSANYLLANNILTQGHLAPQATPCTAYPEDENVTRVRYGNNGVSLLARSWTERNGIVHVGIVYRNEEFSDPVKEAAAHMEDCGTLISFNTIY